MCIFDSGRNLLVEHQFQMGDDRVPGTCALSRQRLHDILLAAAERAGAIVRTGLAADDIRDEADGVSVRFSDGRTNRFDLAAGFDGIRSAA